VIRTVRNLGVLALCACLLACATTQVPLNQPLPGAERGHPAYGDGYALTSMLKDPKGEILFVLAFSGGGKRSAAFAHGALKGLREMQVREDGITRPLLDEVDYIAAVSGGSFPAMHYGVFRDKSFETFPTEFLKRDINAFIWGVYLLPWNWEWLVNPLYGTNDHMADVYDRLMFHGTTYNRLISNGLPLISVNATDIATGLAFPFTQSFFDLLCSDLTTFPVARAVAASNGFPVLFTPITIKSYRNECLGTRPPLVPPPIYGGTTAELSREAFVSRSLNNYLDADRVRWVHLMDGGIADNLALRTLSNALVALDPNGGILNTIAANTRRVIVLSIDGQAASDPTLSQQRIVTGLGQIFSAVSGTQIDAYNFETLLLLNSQVGQLVRAFKKLRCDDGPTVKGHPCDDVRGALIHISLTGIEDAAVRERLQRIPTGLTIPDQDVDDLVAYGSKLVQENSTLREMTSGLDEPAPQPVATPVAAASNRQPHL